VQASFLRFAGKQDKEARVLKSMRARLVDALALCQERASQTAETYSPVTGEQRGRFVESVWTLRLLQRTCEGHNLDLQELLRHQTAHATSVNLLTLVLDLLPALAGTSQHLQKFAAPQLALLEAAIDLVVETMQGPCDGNQVFISQHENALMALKNVLQSGFHPRNDHVEVATVRAKAMICIAAMLEGRRDKLVHEHLAERLEEAVLDKYADDAARFIRAIDYGEEAWWVDEKALEKIKGKVVLGLVAHTTVKAELATVDRSVAARIDGDDGDDGDGDSSLSPQRRQRGAPTLTYAAQFVKAKVASVEVFWNGRVEFVCFPLPAETSFLSTASQNTFFNTVNLTTHEMRMKGLVKAEPNLTAEMQQVYSLAKNSSMYRWMNSNFVAIKMLQYSLVLLLNLNVVMASYGSDTEARAGGNENKGFSSPIDWSSMDSKYNTSLAITWILGVPNFLGYFVIAAFMAVTEVPLVVRTIDAVMDEAEILMQDGVEVKFRNPGAFTWWGVTLFFNISFIIQHQAAYPDAHQNDLYFLLIFGINLPWTLSCIRNYVSVADTSVARTFCIAYDTLVTKPFLRNQMILVFFSVNGFRWASWFTLMLLDVVNISPTVQNLVKSVTVPARALGIVMYLFIVMVVIYSSFALELFEDHFTYGVDDEADNPRGCHSVVGCSWLILYRGVPEGTLVDVFENVDSTDPKFLGRLLFDMSFFVIIGVILFNVITGLMLDTFSLLREQSNEREDKLQNECFVCGLTRTAFDDSGATASTFEQHKNKAHYIWNYLSFIQYLKAKDETEYTGVESYVSELLERSSLAWVPVRTSFASQNSGLGHDSDESARAELRAQIDGFRKLRAAVEQLAAKRL